jgi:tight adherence protein B
VGLTALLAAPGAALAADGDAATASVAHVEAGPGTVQVLVSVPADVEVDLDGVAVTVDGAAARAEARPADSVTAVRRTAVLAIDTSRSMQGGRFRAAKLAAQEFIASVPEDVYVGIVTFAGDVTTQLDPTQDREAARGVLRGLALTRETRLYDGVVQAVEDAGTEGQRSLLVLSAGADTSQTPISAATDAVREAGVLTDVVALDQSAGQDAALQEIAAAGQGRVVPADPAALQATFAAEAEVLARQVLVSATLPDGFAADDGTVAVTLPTATGSGAGSSTGALAAEAFTSLDPLPVTSLAAPATGWSPPPWSLYAGSAALALGLVLAAVALVPAGRPRTTPAQRVAAYAESQRFGAASDTSAEQQGPRLDTDTFASAKETAAQVLRRNRDLDARISARLEAAGSELKSSEWLLVHGAIFFVSGLVGLLLGGGNLVLGLVFLALGLVGPWVYLGLRRSRRRKAFDSGLPETLQLMSGSLAAGLSLTQSVDTIVREGVEPIASEFRRVMVETRLGVTLEDALEGVAERFESKDFAWVVMAIKIQRQVGGNLAELLDTVAATMREREFMRRQVSALAAEGKLSAWVLGGLPPLFMLYLLMTNYDYVIVMFQEPLGWAMLLGAATILGVGVFWMSRLVKVEV